MKKVNELELFGDTKSIHKVISKWDEKFVNMNGGYHFRGYEMMQKAEEFRKKFPKEVQIVSVDDAVYSGSDLVLIEHRSKEQYHGTSVIYIPQCTGEEPIKFFLYPGHRKNLIAALQKLDPRKEYE